MRNEEDDNTRRHGAYRLNREAFDTAKDARKDTPEDSGKDNAPAGGAEPVGASEPPRPFAEPKDDTASDETTTDSGSDSEPDSDS